MWNLWSLKSKLIPSRTVQCESSSSAAVVIELGSKRGRCVGMCVGCKSIKQQTRSVFLLDRESSLSTLRASPLVSLLAVARVVVSSSRRLADKWR